MNATCLSPAPCEPGRLVLDKRGAAGALQISVRKLELLLHEPDPPPHVRFGRSIRFPADQLAAWLRHRTIGAIRHREILL